MVVETDVVVNVVVVVKMVVKVVVSVVPNGSVYPVEETHILPAIELPQAT